MHAHGIMFHHFHDAVHPRAQGSMDAATLRSMLDHLAERHTLLRAEEFQQRAKTGALRPEDLCLTFDDSLRCQYDVARPVLEERGLTGFWFIYTSPMCGVLERLELYRYFRNTAFKSVEDFYDYFFAHVRAGEHGPKVEEALRRYDPAPLLARCPCYSEDDARFRHLRDDVFGEEIYFAIMDGILAEKGFALDGLLEKLWMGAAEVRELRRRGHVIGLHSHTHPTRIAELPAPRQREEYVENKRVLEDVLGEKVVAMSHPSNSYGPETLSLLRELGAEVGFRALMTGGGAALELPRQDHANILREMRAK